MSRSGPSAALASLDADNVKVVETIARKPAGQPPGNLRGWVYLPLENLVDVQSERSSAWKKSCLRPMRKFPAWKPCSPATCPKGSCSGGR